MTDNSIATASITSELPSYSLFDLGIADEELTVEQTIGDENGQDIYAFSVTETGEFNFSLEGLTADADLLLINEDLEQVAISQAYENKSESITTELTPGEYYATVYSHDNVETDYSFSISNISNDLTTEDVPDGEPVDTDTSLGEVFQGDFSDNILEGGAGNDSLYGEGGSDELLGGAGDDFLSGSSSSTFDYSWGSEWFYEPYPIWDNWEDTMPSLIDLDLFSDFGETDSLSTDVFSATTATETSTDIFTDYSWENSYPSLFGNPEDEVDTLTGGEGADTFALGDNLGSYYQDSTYTVDMCDFCHGFSVHSTNDYAVITDFNSQEGDVFQVYGSIEDYTLSTENYTGTELADTLIHYGSDLVAVVSDTTDISLERDFSALGSSPDFDQYFTDNLTV